MLLKEEKIIPLQQLETLYASVGWSSYTRDLETLHRGIEQSLLVLTMWHEEQLVGLIRSVGDGATILYVQDLLVHPTYQNQGVGKALMTELLARFPKVRQKVLLTSEAPDVRGFYESFGFSSCDQGEAVAFYKEF